MVTGCKRSKTKVKRQGAQVYITSTTPGIFNILKKNHFLISCANAIVSLMRVLKIVGLWFFLLDIAKILLHHRAGDP